MLTLFMLFASASVFSQVTVVKQDTIVKQSGDEIFGKVTEVTYSYIVCQIKDSVQVINQIILLEDVFMIKYANGTREVITQTKTEKILKEKDEPGHTISMEKTALGGYRFYQDNIKLHLSDLKMVVASNPKAYIMIKKAKRCRFWSYGLAGYGAVIGIELLGMAASGYDIDRSPIIVGTGSIIGSLILWRKFKENAKNGIDIYNDNLVASSQHKFRPDLKLGVTNNGIGLVLNF